MPLLLSIRFSRCREPGGQWAIYWYSSYESPESLAAPINVSLSLQGYSQVFISIVSFRIYSDSLSAIGFGFLIPASVIEAIPILLFYQYATVECLAQQYCLFVKFNSRLIVMDLLHELPHCQVAFCGFAGIIHPFNKLIHIIGKLSLWRPFLL